MRPPRRRRGGLIAALGAALALAAACDGSDEPIDRPQPGSGVIDLKLANGLYQRVLYRAPERPIAVLVLLTGGDGRITIDGTGAITHGGGSFLVRLREVWLARGIGFAVPQATDPLWGVRSSERYADVLRAIVADLRERTGAPIWLAGQSMGAVAATNGAARLSGGEIAGLVLSSAVTQAGGETVFGAGLARVTVPTLVVAHADDQCVASPASGVPAIRDGLGQARAVEVVLIEGGAPQRGDACQGESPHGYFGVEDRVVERIAAWITARSAAPRAGSTR